MTNAAVEPVFLDTNILVYASVDPSPFHQLALDAIQAQEAMSDEEALDMAYTELHAARCTRHRD